MAVRPIRRIRTDLPVANIYLDDIQEIARIFTDAYSKTLKEPKISIEFEVDSRLGFTEIEELVEHGGSSSNFTMTIVGLPKDGWRRSSSFLTVRKFTAPSLQIASELSEVEYEIFGKIEQIFATRSGLIRRVFQGIPFEIFVAITSLPLIALLGVPFHILFQKLPSAIHLTGTAVLLAIGAGLIIGLVPLLISAKFRISSIYFTYARKDERAREAQRKERIEKLVWLIVGAVLGVVGKTISDHFMR